MGFWRTKKSIAENPDLVRAFVGAFLKGLKDTIDNPDEAFKISEAYIPNFADLDANVQKKILDYVHRTMEGRSSRLFRPASLGEHADRFARYGFDPRETGFE